MGLMVNVFNFTHIDIPASIYRIFYYSKYVAFGLPLRGIRINDGEVSVLMMARSAASHPLTNMTFIVPP